MKKWKKAVIVLAVCGGTAALAIYGAAAARRQATADGLPADAVYAETEAARRETILTKAEGTGVLELVTKHSVYPSTQAKITALGFKAGDEVNAGDVLCAYDKTGLTALLAQQEEAYLNLRVAEINFANGDVSAPTVLSVHLEQAQLAVEVINEQIKRYKTEEVAEVSGTVLSSGYAAGETAVLTKALYVVADTSCRNLVVTVNIPENDAGFLEIGQAADVRIPSLAETFDGVVSKISPTIEKRAVGSASEAAAAVEITLNADDERIKSGYSAEVSILTRTLENVVVIPILAVQSEKDGTRFVYVVDEGRQVRKQPVQPGVYYNLDVQADALAEGDIVVVSPSARVEEGVYVREITR